jgi:CubicO group peptidase (beta-lactamase class C family)
MLSKNDRRVVFISIMILPSLLLSACGTGQVVPADSPDEVAQRLDLEMQNLMSRFRVPGTAVALVDNGQMSWAQVYGLADKETGSPVTPETVFQAASISKAVSAWGVMKLVEEGILDLDAPVERYLTRWHLPPSEFNHDEVTIRRLLSHTAGTSVSGFLGRDPDQDLPTLEEVLSGQDVIFGETRVVQEPGSGYSYSGGGYTLLQLVIEEVSGESFSDYMQREVLDPLGMTSSSFVWTPELEANGATGYNWAGRPLPNFRFTAKAAASLITTAPDLARFAAAVMPGPDGAPAGRGVLEPETVDLMLSPAPATEGAYGLGYAIFAGHKPIVGHGGDNRGFKAIFFSVPVQGVGIVILTNSNRATEYDYRLGLACAWSALLPGHPMQDECRSVQSLINTFLLVAGVLFLGLIAYCGWVAVRVRAGHRRLGWAFSWLRVLRIALLLLAVALWQAILYTDILFAAIGGPPVAVIEIVPMAHAFQWISWAVSLWGVALIVATFAPRVRQQPSSKAAPS